MNELFIFVAGCAIGALSSWLITHRYYIKAGADQKAELAVLSEQLRSRNKIEDFEDLLCSSSWTKNHIGNQELWIASTDNTYQIVVGDSDREFSEPWTKVYPCTSSTACSVYLKIGSTTIKELTFISMDGGRILVPITESRPNSNGGLSYLWDTNSLGVKVCRIIGTYYIYEDLEGVARRSGVSIVP